jgi:signal transduction histidine kinase
MMHLSYASVWTAAFASGLYLLGALLVYYRRSKRPGVAQIAVLYLSAAALWNAGLALQESGRLPFVDSGPFAELVAIGLVFITALFLLLTRYIMGYRNRGWIWIILGLMWCFFAVLIGLAGWLLTANSSLGDGWQSWLQTGLRIWLILGWGVFLIGSVYFSLRTYQQTSHYSQEAPYWMGVLLLIGVGDAAWWAGFGPAGDVLHILGGASIVVVISQARLPVLGDTSRRLVSGVIYSVLVIICYTIGLTLALTLAHYWPDTHPLLIGLLFAVLLALLLNPGLGLVQRSMQERVSDPKDELTELLRQYSQSITNTLDLNLLATVAVGTASEFLEIRRGSLYLVDLEKNNGSAGEYALRGVKGMGSQNPEFGKLRWESPLAEVFRSGSQPITHNQINSLPNFPAITEEERKWLESLGASVYVPIDSKDQWIGLLVLGPKVSGKEYTPQDLAFLSTMAGQTAVALENARLVEGLLRANEVSRRAYQALDQATRHLERMDKAKSDFISIVSHELRTPMNLISGASHMLLDESELQNNPYYKQVLENLHHGAMRLEKIIESMLDMARIDTRLMVLELQPVAIQSVIRLVHDDLAKDATGRKQTIEFRDLEKLPAVVADLAALRKVFYNLVINAIKYTPDGGKITIWGRDVPVNEKEFPTGAVEVVVSDTGIGIDPSFRDLVFVKFYQTGESALHSSGRSKFKGGGPGLGLAIARGIVEAHQGKIWVESAGCDEKKCPGSQFHVILPLRPVAQPEPRQDSDPS